MKVELRQLRCLVAIAEAGTFTDAGIELGMSQAAVSRAVAGLEAELGVRLLRRTTRQVAATAAGARVIARARRILAEVGELERTAGEQSELRVGFAWSALGRHTTALQRAWTRGHPATELTFVQANTPTAGLAEGLTEIAVVRRKPEDPRFDSALVATEARYAAAAGDDVWARRRFLRLADFAGRTVALDPRTGTTTLEVWAGGPAPGAVRETHSVDEWLTLIASGQAVGMTAEATVAQYPRPGIVYRPVRDAAPVPVWIIWWRDDPPALRSDLIRLACDLYST
jgi:DNA-binding transcriptional LysR family regulator